MKTSCGRLPQGRKATSPKMPAPAEFKQAIRLVHSGEVWAPRRVLANFIERVTASAAARQIKPRDGQIISRRQRQVLGLLAVGSSNREIAGQLGLTERTVKAHVAELLRKIGAPNRIALVCPSPDPYPARYGSLAFEMGCSATADKPSARHFVLPISTHPGWLPSPIIYY